MQPQDPLYIVLHIYKTAGQTLYSNFAAGLERPELLPMYVGPMGLDVDKRSGTSANPGWIAQPVKDYVRRCVTNSTRCLFGHMTYYGIHELVRGPREPRYVTFLRDPVERVVSLYYYLRDKSTNYWHREIVESNWSLEEWVTRSEALWAHNGQVRQLLLGTRDEVETTRELTHGHLEEAKRRLRQFWYVGLIETFAQDADYLYGKLRFYKFHRETVVNSTPRTKVVRRQARQLIADCNRLDQELYQFASALRRQFVRRRLPNYHWNIMRARVRRYRFFRRQLESRRDAMPR